MTIRPTHDTLREALRSLPRARAADGFTERVLTHAEAARQAHRPRLAATRWAVAAAVGGFALAGALAVPTFRAERTQNRERQARIQAIEAERRQLAAELEEIRRLAETAQGASPVLYLGGDEDVDLVLDLGRLAGSRPGGTGVTPAAYSGGPRY